MKTRSLLYLMLSLLLFLDLSAQPPDRKTLRYKPANLYEAVYQLDLLFPDSIKNQIREMTEEKFLAGTHLTTGMWIRNHWSLWKHGTLTRYFNRMGIYHPDDMSGIILSCYYRQLLGQPRELEKQIGFYQDYWANLQEHERLMKSDTVYVREVHEQEQQDKEAYYEKLQEPFPPGSIVRAWVNFSDGVFTKGRTQVEGIILAWDEMYAILKITDFMEERKEKRVRRYNRMSGNTLAVAVFFLENYE